MAVKFTVNWDDAETYSLLDPGIYEAVIETKGLPADTTKNGDPAFTVKFHVQYEGRKVPIQKKYALGGNGLGFTKSLVEAALGVQLKGKTSFDPAVLHGKHVRVQVEHFESSKTPGRLLNSIGMVLPLADAVAEEAETEEEDVLAKLLSS